MVRVSIPLTLVGLGQNRQVYCRPLSQTLKQRKGLCGGRLRVIDHNSGQSQRQLVISARFLVPLADQVPGNGLGDFTYR